MYQITDFTERCNNFYRDRRDPLTGGRYKPFVICNHITVGSLQSVYNWFTSPSNNRASSHFVVGRDGEIHQYVDLQHAAWTQGLVMPQDYARTRAQVVKNVNPRLNPNTYMVSIEHEGYNIRDNEGRIVEKHGEDGELTEEQFWATAWLHRFIKDELKRMFDVTISLNDYFVIGHHQVDPVRKPFCPGPQFPWSRLYSELAIANNMTLEDYEQRIVTQRSAAQENVKIYEVAQYLYKLNDVAQRGDDKARQILLDMSLYAKSKGYV